MVTKSKGSTAQDIDLTGLVGGIKLKGTVTFTAALTTSVVFAAAEVDTAYKVFITPQANKTFWVTKSTTGFTISASAVSSDAVDWMIPVR